MPEPHIGAQAFIAPGAVLTGDVTVHNGAGVWYASVLRGDGDSICIGENSNIQDGCVLHTDPGFPLQVGRGVTVGHRALLHGCILEDGALVGMGAIVMNGAVVGTQAMVAAGALVPEGMQIPPRMLAVGVPAKIKRFLTDDELIKNRENAAEYVRLAQSRHETPAPRG